KTKVLLDFSRGFLSGSFNWVRHKVYPPAGERGRMGVGVSARLQHNARNPAMGPESLELGPDVCLNMGPESETGVPLSLRLLLEMGGVCYEPGRPNRGVRCDGPDLSPRGLAGRDGNQLTNAVACVWFGGPRNTD